MAGAKVSFIRRFHFILYNVMPTTIIFTQEVDEQGNTVSERVEQVLDETKELITQLESKNQTQSLVDTSLHTLIGTSQHDKTGRWVAMVFLK